MGESTQIHFLKTDGTRLILVNRITWTWTRVLSIDTAGNPFLDWMMTLVMVLIATILVAITGWRNLSRTTRIQE